MKDSIKKDMIQAMKSGEKEKVGILRILINEIKKAEINNQQSESSDDEILKTIQKLIKQSKESTAQFRNAGREDLASKEEREASILNEYLPQQMSQGDMDLLIEQTIKDLNASGMSDMGIVMGYLKQKYANVCDMAYISVQVKLKLNS